MRRKQRSSTLIRMWGGIFASVFFVACSATSISPTTEQTLHTRSATATSTSTASTTETDSAISTDSTTSTSTDSITSTASVISTSSTTSTSTVTLSQLTVTVSGDSNETISPTPSVTVSYGSVQTFTVTAATLYTVSPTVGGTCPAGTWSGSVYSTGSITTDCSVTFSAHRSQIMYIPDVGNHALQLCYLSVAGGLSACTAYSITDPSGIAFATLGGVEYAYVTQTTPGVRVCTLGVNGSGALTCTSATSGISPVWSAPTGIAIATVNGTQYAYIADDNGANVYQCTLRTSNGTFSACSVMTNPGFTSVRGITFSTVNGTQYAYVADVGNWNNGDGAMYKCTLNSTSGGFSAFGPTGSGFGGPWGVTFSTVNGTQYAYVADVQNGVFACTLTSAAGGTNGDFATCTATPASPPDWDLRGIAIGAVNGTQYAYVSSFYATTPNAGTLYQCSLNLDGTLLALQPKVSYLRLLQDLQLAPHTISPSW